MLPRLVLKHIGTMCVGLLRLEICRARDTYLEPWWEGWEVRKTR